MPLLLSCTEPDGRIGRAGASQSYGSWFNHRLGPILNATKIFEVFGRIFVTDDDGSSYRLRVRT